MDITWIEEVSAYDIHLSGTITSRDVADLMTSFMKHRVQKIRIIITKVNMEAADIRSICDIFKMAKSNNIEMRCILMGQLYISSLLISSICHESFITENSIITLGELVFGVNKDKDFTLQHLENEVDNFKNYRNMIYGILHTKNSEFKLPETQTPFTAQQIEEFGFATVIERISDLQLS